MINLICFVLANLHFNSVYQNVYHLFKRLIHISLLAVELQEKNEVAESCNIWYNDKI